MSMAAESGKHLKLEKVVKGSFTVIGKEGSSADGDGFIRKLWEDANSHFEEIAPLAKRDENGNLAGIWGAMSDLTRSFLPWEEFKTGLYLAGAECWEDAEAPEAWVKWVVPGYEYLRVENKGGETFADAVKLLKERKIALVGAVHEFTCPLTGKDYLYFPVRRLVMLQMSDEGRDHSMREK